VSRLRARAWGCLWRAGGTAVLGGGAAVALLVAFGAGWVALRPLVRRAQIGAWDMSLDGALEEVPETPEGGP
jgi:hypothetical protein